MTSQADIVFRGNATSAVAASREASSGVASVGTAGKKAESGLSGATAQSESFAKSIKRLAVLTIGTFGAVEAVRGIRSAIDAAGDLEKQQQRVVRVFGDTPKVLQAFSATSAKSYGISQLAADKSAASVGALLKNLGDSPKAAAGLSVGIQKLAADMGSFNNVPTADVVNSITRAMLGQTRGLKTLGVSISANDVIQKAYSSGLVKRKVSAEAVTEANDRLTAAELRYGQAVLKHGATSGQAAAADASLRKAHDDVAKALDGETAKLTPLQTALASYALIVERTKVQQGDFQRSSGDLANEQKVLSAEFGNLQDRIGTGLLPVAKDLVTFMAGPGINAAGSFLTTVSKDGEGAYNALRPLAPAAHAAAAGFQELDSIQGLIPALIGTAVAYKGVTTAFTTGQAAITGGAALLSNLASPFRTVSGAAADVTTELRFMNGGWTTVTTSAEDAAPAFLGLANPIAAIATVSALAVGGLILLGSTEDSIAQKTQRAADAFRGLGSAQNSLKSSATAVAQAHLNVAEAERNLAKETSTLFDVEQKAHQAFPPTIQGRKDEAAATDKLNGELLVHHGLVLAVTQAKEDATSAEDNHTDAINASAKASTTADNAFDGLAKKLLADTTVIQRDSAARGAHVTLVQNEATAAENLAGKIDEMISGTKGLSSAQKTGLTDIRNFVSAVGKIPDKTTLSLLVNDAATGKIKALQTLIANLQGKTVTIAEQIKGTNFPQINPITGVDLPPVTRSSHARGGRSPGSGAFLGGHFNGVDSIHTILAPGERVLNPGQVALADSGVPVDYALAITGAPTIGGGTRHAKGGKPPLFSHEGPDLYAAAYHHNRPFAKPGPYQTRLSDAQEAAFRVWLKKYDVPFDPNAQVVDYDMRGYWLANRTAVHHGGEHFPDTWKTPYDTTFSDESKYATKNNPFVWRGNNLVDSRTGQLIFGTPTGHAGGGSLASEKAKGISLAQGEAKSSASSKARAKASAKKPQTFIEKWQKAGSKLPGDDAFNTALSRAQANLDDASRTSIKSDDVKALHALIRLANHRLTSLHPLRAAHKEFPWQQAVNAEISTVDQSLAGYKTSLATVAKKITADDITVGIPSSIAWQIQRASLTDDLSDDVAAYKAEQKWLLEQINARDKKTGKFKLSGAKLEAYKRAWQTAGLELDSLGAQQATATQDAATAAEQLAETPPDVPLSIQEALADAALTPGTADDLAALQNEAQFLQGAIASEPNQTARVALKQSLAGVQSQISDITGGSGTTNPDQDAQTAQLQARLAAATTSAQLSEAEVASFGSSGDIGTGGFGNAFQAAANGPPQLALILADSRTAAAIASSAVQGFSQQPAITANRATVNL